MRPFRGNFSHTPEIARILLDTHWLITMEINNLKLVDGTRITASFTREELDACFDSSDDENSEEEDTDAEAMRQSIRNAERDLEQKRYAYYRRMLLENQRERKENRKRIIREALERERRAEEEAERVAKEEFQKKQESLQLSQHIKKVLRDSHRERLKRKRQEQTVVLDDADDEPLNIPVLTPDKPPEPLTVKRKPRECLNGKTQAELDIIFGRTSPKMTTDLTN